MKKKLYLGIDVGGTKIMAGLVTEAGKILSREKISSPKNLSSAETVALISDLISDILKKNGLKTKALSGIGLGVPGLVMPGTGEILDRKSTRLNSSH